MRTGLSSILPLSITVQPPQISGSRISPLRLKPANSSPSTLTRNSSRRRKTGPHGPPLLSPWAARQILTPRSNPAYTTTNGSIVSSTPYGSVHTSYYGQTYNPGVANLLQQENNRQTSAAFNQI